VPVRAQIRFEPAVLIEHLSAKRHIRAKRWLLSCPAQSGVRLRPTAPDGILRVESQPRMPRKLAGGRTRPPAPDIHRCEIAVDSRPIHYWRSRRHRGKPESHPWLPNPGIAARNAFLRLKGLRILFPVPGRCRPLHNLAGASAELLSTNQDLPSAWSDQVGAATLLMFFLPWLATVISTHYNRGSFVGSASFVMTPIRCDQRCGGLRLARYSLDVCLASRTQECTSHSINHYILIARAALRAARRPST